MKPIPTTREALLKYSSGKGLTLADVAKTLGIPEHIAASWNLKFSPDVLQLDAPELALLQEGLLTLYKTNSELLSLTKNRLESVLIDPAFKTPDTTPDLFRFFLRLLYAIRDLLRSASPPPQPPEPADPEAARRAAELTTDVVDKFIVWRASDNSVPAVADMLHIPLCTAQEWDSRFHDYIVSCSRTVGPDTLRRQILASRQNDPARLAALRTRTESNLVRSLSRDLQSPDELRFNLQLLYRIQDLSHSHQSLPATPAPTAPDTQNPQNLAA